MANVDNRAESVNIKKNVLQCKIFRINMTPEDNQKDLHALNKFLFDNSILSIKEQFVTGKVDYWLAFVTYEYKNETTIKNATTEEIVAPKADQNEIDKSLLAKLKKWRTEKCSQSKLPAYIILHNKTADELAKIQPTAYENLDKIMGIGQKFKEKYGSEIIDLIVNHQKECAK